MYINKIIIQNFKCFREVFTLDLNRGLNILVGNNEAGKSTILEAIHLALTGLINGRPAKSELSPYLFNKEIEADYLASLTTAFAQRPPRILIEVYVTGESSSALSLLQGNCNSAKADSCGVAFSIEFDEQYQSEYEELLKVGEIKGIPIEYYRIQWRSFAREMVTARGIPVKSSLIDAAATRTQNGSDIYISRIIRDNLDDKERVEISQAHREMKEAFMAKPSVMAINSKINKGANISDKSVKISVDLATQNAWEMSLVTYLNDIPFHYIGKGEQNIVKTSLALSHRKSQEANIILLEEPENHLSHSKLNELIRRIKASLSEKQIIVSTHSSFVLNKLGVDNLVLLNDRKSTKLSCLSPDTKQFFLKLAGYDTLRLVLSKRVILVEGDSDELVVQKAYLVKNGKLPIEDGIDVISVGTSFLRFLEIAEKLNKPVSVVTDNDGNVEALRKKYSKYIGRPNFKICFDEIEDAGAINGFNYNTLEPKMLKANGREVFNKIFGTKFENDSDLLKFMKRNKTDCALKLFGTAESIVFPEYISNAIS